MTTTLNGIRPLTLGIVLYATAIFHAQHPEVPGPLAHLDRWLSAAEREEFKSEHIDNSKPVHRETISKPVEKVQ
jgi:hypothetical protein